LAHRTTEPPCQQVRGLSDRHPRLEQLRGRVDPLGVLPSTSTSATINHDIRILLDMSRTLCDTTRPFQPSITQRDIKAEIAQCVGGVASPVLSNIYLDRLDQYVEQRLLPEHNLGRRRRTNRAYQVLEYAIQKARRHGDRDTARKLTLQRRALPSQDPNDPDYRRLRYVRYCDDWLLGFAGPKHEAEDIKSKIAAFLRDELKLELSQSKTLITHATSQAAHFLGYEIRTQHSNTKITRGRRAVNAAIGLFVPKTVIRQRCALYMSKGKPAQRGALIRDDDFTIVAKYGSEYAGLVQYYLLAQDVFRLARLRWVMETSMLKTLAGKHRSSVTKMARKYKATIETPAGPRKVFQVTVERDRGRKPLVARFGGIPLRRNRTAVLTDQRPVMTSAKRNELIHRLLAGRCEICEAVVNLEVHHIRKLADLTKPGRREKPAWMHLMAMRRRKTLVICRHCHEDIHAGRATKPYPK
jgi:type II intron maturase/AI2M/AI1M-like HNH endonuclease/reverse transcriptase-like protein